MRVELQTVASSGLLCLARVCSHVREPYRGITHKLPIHICKGLLFLFHIFELQHTKGVSMCTTPAMLNWCIFLVMVPGQETAL